MKLSINSNDGRRLSLRIVRKGEILGLTSALSGQPYEVTAETLYPAKLYPIGRREFLGFVMRHPEVYQVFSEELTREFTMACEQLRTVGSVVFRAREAGAAVARLERERPGRRERHQGPVLHDA